MLEIPGRALLAGKEKLHNLIAIIDRNNIQIDGLLKIFCHSSLLLINGKLLAGSANRWS